MALRWSHAEDLAVLSGVGSYGWSGLQSRSGDSYRDANLPPGRTANAVKCYLQRKHGVGVRRGTVSLAQLAKDTGYNRAQLRRAQKALNQKWQRTSKRGAHLITIEQTWDLVEWLRHDFWTGRKHLYACVWCSTSLRPHRSGGLCSRCVFRYRRRCLEQGIPSSLREQRKILDDMILDCANTKAHGKILEEARSRIRKGLALTEGMLEWLVTMYERTDLSGTDFRGTVSVDTGVQFDASEP